MKEPVLNLLIKKMYNIRVVSFIWGKMLIAAREISPQIALRDCSKEAVGVGKYIRFW